MVLVNRAVLIVKPKQPFLDWANSTEGPRYDPDDAFPFLVAELDGDKRCERTVMKHYREIFEQALYSWMTDESIWPPKRDLKMFRKWFDAEYHEPTADLCKAALEAEEF